MHNCIPQGYLDILGDAGRAHLSHLSDYDHVKIIDYLSKVPTDQDGISIGLIHGPPGTGKTYLMSQVTYAILCAQPEAKILVVASSNPAVDLLLQISKRLYSMNLSSKQGDPPGAHRCYGDKIHVSICQTSAPS
jgi:hypothetical protein